MKSWQLMAGWPLLCMRLLRFSLLKPSFHLNSGKTVMDLLDGSCGPSEKQGSLPALVPGQERGRAGPAWGIPANLWPSVLQGTYTVSTCSPFSRRGPQGYSLQLYHLEVGTEATRKESSLRNWHTASRVLNSGVPFIKYCRRLFSLPLPLQPSLCRFISE